MPCSEWHGRRLIHSLTHSRALERPSQRGAAVTSPQSSASRCPARRATRQAACIVHASPGTPGGPFVAMCCTASWLLHSTWRVAFGPVHRGTQACDMACHTQAGASWHASMRRGMPYAGRCIVMRKYATSVRKYANQTFDRIVGPPAESDNPRMRRQSSRFALLEEVCGNVDHSLGLAKRIDPLKHSID